MTTPSDVPRDAEFYLIALLRLNNIHVASVKQGIERGHLTELDWVNALDLFRGFREGKMKAASRASRRTWKGRMSELEQHRFEKLWGKRPEGTL